MANQVDRETYLSDGFEALKVVAGLSWRKAIISWFHIPIGILVILLACFGVNSLIGLSSVSFPASVAVLVLLFIALSLSEYVIGDRKTKQLVKIIDIPTGFTLRYLSIFFTPSFVLLPLSPSIGGSEVGKIIAVFLIGFFAVLTGTAFLVRALQLLLGSSKRAQASRADELGNESVAIPFTDSPSADTRQNSTAALFTPSPSTPGTPLALDDLLPPQRAQDPSLIRGTGGPPETDLASRSIRRVQQVLQTPLPLTRPQRWAYIVNQNFDRLTYAFLFVFIGLPVFYATGYAMPAQLTINVLAYFAALSLPATWRKFLHPVLVSAGLTILSIWMLGLTRGDSLTTTLDAYRTHITYLSLWSGRKSLASPGAGDLLVSILDAGIVALALPMYTHRSELRHHFLSIAIPNISVSIGSLFAYPPLCYAIGISASRSLAFPVRSLTLALATPAAQNLGGDANTASALAICSGILGALVGPQFLDWVRIPVDDYVTRGVTLGGSSSAIVTAVLLQTDPRAAALSSLSMSLFGIITLALTSVPVIVKAVGSLVGE